MDYPHFLLFLIFIFALFFYNKLTLFLHKNLILFPFFLSNFKINKILFFISPDYYHAGDIKKKFNPGILKTKSLEPTNEITLSHEQFEKLQCKKILIINWNYINILFTILLFIFVGILDSFLPLIYKEIIFFLFVICFYRALSRSIEIILAFFKDVTSCETQNPFLESNIRIKLALLSLIETIFNFATLNYLNSLNYFFKTHLEKYYIFFKNTNPPKNIICFFIKSFNTSISVNSNSIISILQVITSLVIVLFAFAGYLNSKSYKINKVDKF